MSAPHRSFLLRIDPAIHAAVERWARDELRSVNGQIEFLLRQSLAKAGRLPPPAGKDGAKPEGGKRKGG